MSEFAPTSAPRSSHFIPSRLFRLFCAFAGANPAVLDHCPAPDKYFVVRIGLHLLLTLIFISGSLFFSMSYSLASDFNSELFVTFLSLSIATAVFLFDIYIVQTSWEEDGQQALERVSRDQRFRFRRRSRLFKIIPRIVVSVVVALVIAVFLDLYIYKAEVYQELKRAADEDTKAAKNKIRSDIKSDVSIIQSQIDALSKNIDESTKPADPNTIKAISDLTVKSESLASRIASLKRRIGQNQARLNTRISTLQKQILRSNIQNLNIQIANLQSQIDDYNKNITVFRSTIPSASQLAADPKGFVDQRKTLIEQLNRKNNDIETEVDNRFLQQGGPTAPKNGFSDKFSALIDHLHSTWSTIMLFILLSVLMMFVEASAVMSKIFFSPKTIYAIRVATGYNNTLRQEAFSPDPSDKDEVEKLRLRAEIEVLKAEIGSHQKRKS